MPSRYLPSTNLALLVRTALRLLMHTGAFSLLPLLLCRSTVSRRRTAVTAPRSGGQASAIAVLLLGAGAFGWWFWKRRRDAAGDAGGGRRPKKGGSSFRFPGMKRGTGAAAAAGAHPKSGTAPRGAPAVKVAGMRRAASSGGGGAAGGGNPKQSNKRARREEKAARKEAKCVDVHHDLIHTPPLLACQLYPAAWVSVMCCCWGRSSVPSVPLHHLLAGLARGWS